MNQTGAIPKLDRVVDFNFNGSEHFNSTSVAQKEVYLTIPKLNCAASASQIERSLEQLDGVYRIDINLAASQICVGWYEDLTSLDHITGQLYNIGFPVSGDEDQKKQGSGGKQLFCALLLALPLLLLNLAEFSRVDWSLPIWVQCALAAVIQFGFGARFYAKAWLALRTGKNNLDMMIAAGSSIAFGYSLYSWLVQSSTELFFDVSALVICFALAAKWLERRARNQTSLAIQKLTQLQPAIAHKWVSDNLMTFPVGRLSIADELQIQPGERIPADGIILDGFGSIDENDLNGETEAIAKQKGDYAFAGSININGNLRIRVTRQPGDFLLNRIVRRFNEAQMQKSSSQKSAERIADVLMPLAVIAATLSFGFNWYQGNLNEAFMELTAIFVIACPCVLTLAIPSASLAASSIAARRGIYFRDANQLKDLAQARTLVFDKTGTLTSGQPRVANLVRWNKSGEWLALVKSIQKKSHHPFARAMAKSLGKIPAADAVIESKQFDGLGVVSVAGRNRILIGNEQLMNRYSVKLEDKHYQNSESHHSLVWVVVNNVIVGRFDLTDRVRERAHETIDSLRQSGYDLWLLSGDQKGSTSALAGSLGIANVRANLSPAQKLDQIVELKKQPGKVVVISDGFSADATASADACIALGNEQQAAMEHSAVALTRPDISRIFETLQIARKAHSLIQRNLIWAALFNLIGIPVAALGLLSPIAAAAAMATISSLIILNSISALGWQPEPVRPTPSNPM